MEPFSQGAETLPPVLAAQVHTVFAELVAQGHSPWLRGTKGTCRVDLADDGSWLMTIDEGITQAMPSYAEADCVLTTSVEHFLALAHGETQCNAAMLRGNLQMSGDIGLAQRVLRLFSTRRQPLATLGGDLHG